MLNIWLVSSSLRMSEVTALVPWLRSTCEGVEAAASATCYNSSRVHGLTLCFADLGMCFAAAVASNPVRSSFVFKTGAPHKVKKKPLFNKKLLSFQRWHGSDLVQLLSLCVFERVQLTPKGNICS